MRKWLLILGAVFASIVLCWNFPLRADPTDFQKRPIPMGVSISTTPTAPYLVAGTAGMLVHSLFSPDIKFILSANHVIGAQSPTMCPNTAVRGETWVIQPGTLDLGYDPGQALRYFFPIC